MKGQELNNANTAFEKWLLTDGVFDAGKHIFLIKLDTNPSEYIEYRYAHTQEKWAIWQAAWEAARDTGKVEQDR